MPSPSEDDAVPLTEAFQGLLSPETLDFLHTAALHPHSPVQIFKRRAAIHLQQGLNVAYAFASPLIDRFFSYAADAPEMVGLAAFAALLVAVWIVLGWVRRLMMFATRLAFRLLFWALVGLGVALVAKNGVFESVKAVVVVGGKVLGFLAVVKDVWVGELRRYEEEARVQGRR